MRLAGGEMLIHRVRVQRLTAEYGPEDSGALSHLIPWILPAQCPLYPER